MGKEDEANGILGSYRVLDLTQDGCMLCGKMLGEPGADEGDYVYIFIERFTQQYPKITYTYSGYLEQGNIVIH